MQGLNRREFLRLAAAAGAAIPVGVALAGASRAQWAGAGGVFTFRAVAGLPALPLPTIASHVLAGHVDPATRTGVIRQTIFAGAPAAMSTTALPGLSRVVRVVDVREAGSALDITGVADDRSQRQWGDGPTVRFRIDRAHGLVWAGFHGSETALQLDS